MRGFLLSGVVAAGLLARPGTAAAPARAAALPASVAAVDAATPSATVAVRSKKRHRHHRRYHRQSRWFGHDWRGRGITAGRSPYGCYYDEGGGRRVSCTAGGYR
jgi:hypothetical protein